MENNDIKTERAVLAGLSAGSMDISERSTDISMQELAALVETAGGEAVGMLVQNRPTPDPRSFIGDGKVAELKEFIERNECDLAVFDNELSPSQMRVLSEELGVKVLDRSGLILDIFAQRARTREGQLQVELAQLKYELPRIFGQGKDLSRQGSGTIARGPGETKLESDKRRIRRRIYELGEELKTVEKQRGLRRERRQKEAVARIALVGYTNAGKSTLLNALTGAGVLAEDKLFATLDPVVRQVALPNGSQALLSDTVGFINKLPHELVTAFHSTLEEVRQADLILHVVDVSASYYPSQMQVVEEVLASLGAGDIPCIRVYNKADQAQGPLPQDGVAISALQGTGLEALLQAVEQALSARYKEISLVIPYDKYEAMALLKREGRILEETHEGAGTLVRAQVEEGLLWRLKRILGQGETQ